MIQTRYSLRASPFFNRITIRNRFLIAWAWGPRRATSKTRYGQVTDVYPKSVTASWRLWATWFRKGTGEWLRGQTAIVIPTKPASQKARTLSAVVSEPSNSAPANHIDIEALQAERQRLRAQRRFAEADEIREKILAAGFEVKDAAIVNTPSPAERKLQ